MTGIGELTLYCTHVDDSHVHCNRYAEVEIALDQTPQEAVAASPWNLVDGQVRCPEHS